MAKTKGPPQAEADGMVIPLRRPEIAALLAWLIPGAGHYYQRRYNKAALYCLSILSLFLIGMFLGSGRVVYWSWTVEDPRWHYLCQLGVGLPSLPAAIQGWWARSNPEPLFYGFMAKPANLAVLDEWHNQSSAGFDLGCLYTMIAGLLNYLVIFDAFAGPLPLPGTDSRKKKDEAQKDAAKEKEPNALPDSSESEKNSGAESPSDKK